MEKNSKKDMLLHYAVATIGGFLGGYTIVNHSDIFGNAQTANMIHLVVDIFSGKFDGIIYLILSFFAFVAGNAVFALLRKFCPKLDIRAVSLTLTSVAIIIIGAIPNLANDYLSILPIVFVMPIQWNAFTISNGYNSSTIFSSNNLRQATIALTEYIVDKDKRHKHKAIFYCLTLGSFHAGVALSCVTSLYFGVSSVWFCFIPVTLSVISYVRLEWDNLTFVNRKNKLKLKLKTKNG